MDKGDIIYYGIIAIVIITSIFKKVKKSGTSENEIQPQAAEAQQNPWSEILQELNSIDENPEPETEIIDESFNSINQEQIFEKEKQYSNKHKPTESKQKRSKSDLKQTEISDHSYKINNAQDLKKAIVYSEILNRKEY